MGTRDIKTWLNAGVILVSGFLLILLLLAQGYKHGYGKLENMARENRYVEMMYQNDFNVRICRNRNTRYMVARVLFRKEEGVDYGSDPYMQKRNQGVIYVELDLDEDTPPAEALTRFFMQWRSDGYRGVDGIFASLDKDGSVKHSREDIQEIQESVFLAMINRKKMSSLPVTPPEDPENEPDHSGDGL